MEKELFLPTYKRIPLDIDYGKGVYLFDKQGNKYLDLFSGLAVNALGYAHPEIVKAVTDQISRFAHLSNSYITGIQIEFTERLLKYSKMDKAFLVNSGTEAVEAAIKLVRKIKGPKKKLIAFTGSFHGRTYGALSLTARKKYRDGFEPLLPEVIHLQFNDIDALRSSINENTAAVFIELIQGEGGIFEASAEFVKELLLLKEKFDFILVLDEIQSGIGRTGFPFAYDIFSIHPDIMVTAKAIGGGLPLGAMLTSNKFKETFTSGSHGTTFGGNPVCCAAGNVVLKEVFENGLLQKVKASGEYFKEQLINLKNNFPKSIKEIRGKGFMIGVELFFKGDEMVKLLREKGILVNVTNETVIRILPPLILTNAEIDIFITKFREALNVIRN